MRGRGAEAGVTLIEMVIVMAIVAMIAAVSFPSVASGLDGIELRSAADGVAGFITAAMGRADRREQAMEVTISPKENAVTLVSSEPGYSRRYELGHGIHIAGDEPTEFLLLPGGAPPAVAIDLFNKRGAHRIVRIDPVTGVPLTEESR